MAEEQICEPCSMLDLSVHPNTDKQSEWWSKRAVILLHGCVDALVPPSSPSFADACCYTYAHVGYRISHLSNAWLQNMPSTISFSNYYELLWSASTFFQTVMREHSLWACADAQFMVCFYAVHTTLCDIQCHMFMLLRRDCKRTCGNMLQLKVQYVLYKLPLFLLALPDVFLFPSLPFPGISGVTVLHLSLLNQSLGEESKIPVFHS